MSTPKCRLSKKPKRLEGARALSSYYWASALLNQPASKVYTGNTAPQNQPWKLLMTERHPPSPNPSCGVGWGFHAQGHQGAQDNLISPLPPFLCPAAMERQGHGPHGHPCGQSQALLGHSQRGRHCPAEREQVPLCDPL